MHLDLLGRLEEGLIEAMIAMIIVDLILLSFRTGFNVEHHGQVILALIVIATLPQAVESWVEWWRLLRGPASLVLDAALCDAVAAAGDNYESVTKELHALSTTTLVGERICLGFLSNEKNAKVKAIIMGEIDSFFSGDITNEKVCDMITKVE